MRKIWRLFIVPCLWVLGVPLSGQINRQLPAIIPENYVVEEFRSSWRVLEPITRGNLSIFPVVSALRVDTSGFITLDEGVAGGVVKIMERGQLGSAIYRPRDGRRSPQPPQAWPALDGASVNELVLVNESSRPLILLAGEVVSGGRQNRIIGADLVVPPKSDPVPLSVFCVEHGRWTAGGSSFASAQAIAHPTIRLEAQISKSQEGVWDSVGGAAAALRAASPTQSYVDVLNSPEVKGGLEKVATSIETEYERELRDRLLGGGAVGVVVAINGELLWSDVFPSAELFGKYWPKLLRSYVMEAQSGFGIRDWGLAKTRTPIHEPPTLKAAVNFLFESRGHVTVDMEADAYRRTQIAADDYQVVVLEALGLSALRQAQGGERSRTVQAGKSEKASLPLHYNKMTRS
jgi:hypothetical protein